VPSLARFRSWDELVEEAEEARDPELRFLVHPWIATRLGGMLVGVGHPCGQPRCESAGGFARRSAR